MCNPRLPLYFVLLCCLTIQFVKSEGNELAKKAKPNVILEHKGQPDKRDSRKQEGTKTDKKVQQQSFSNDEPFRPIYRPPYFPQYNAAPKAEQYYSQAETYYDKPQLTNGIRYVAPSRNDGSTGNAATSAPTSSTPAHSAAPLLASHLSSSGGGGGGGAFGGIRYAADSYRGPFKPIAYEYPVKPLVTVQQKQKTTKVSPTLQKVKGPQYNSAYVEPVTSFLFDRALSKPLQQKGEHQQQQRLVLQPLHHHQHQQPYIPFYNPHQHQHQSLNHQQFKVRTIPQQQHFQYIVAIPLSYIRQLQQQQKQQQHQQQEHHHHQLATGISASSLYEVPLSASKPESSVTAQPILGPLGRDHYGSYRPVHYASNQQAQHVTPSAQHHYNNQKPQYTTQYIQIPTSILHAAAQAAHAYQNRQQAPAQASAQEQEQQTTSFQQSQPQYTYNIYQQQQPQENEQQQQQHQHHEYKYEYEQEQQQQQQHHAPVYVHAAQEKAQTQEAIIHVGGANPSAKNTPTKTYSDNNQIPTTPTSTTPFKAPPLNSIVSLTAPAEAAPIVHYNPIYVQGPPPEQQSLFGALNYHRFAVGGLGGGDAGFGGGAAAGFHATTPVPFVRLSVPPSSHYYTTLPHHHAYPNVNSNPHPHAHPLPHPHLHFQHSQPQQNPNQHQQQQQQLQLQLPQHQHQSQAQTQSQLEPIHTGLEHKTIYGGYASEQIPNIAAGLPYFTHPGGVHYGTHLYHPTTAFFASPSIPSKATETVSGSSVRNQHQQPEQQTLHSQYPSSPSLQAANVTPTANGNAETSPLVKYP